MQTNQTADETSYDRINDYGAVRISLASPHDIRSWSFGEVKKPETINYRTYRPEKDGLFCERIFGPEKDWECACGKYRGTKYKGMICDRCGVKVTHSRVRRKRMGHIELAAPVVHIWFLKARPRPLGTLLNMKTTSLEKIIYFREYVITDPGQHKGAVVPGTTKKIQERELLSEDEFRRARETLGDGFVAEMGAEAVKKLLEKLDLVSLSRELREALAAEMHKEATGGKSSKQKMRDLVKRLKVVESLRDSGLNGPQNKPEWMVLECIPVIPPDLRPLVLLDSGNFATSDLNDLYRRIINRNNRLKKLVDLNAPPVIIRNEKRMLQQSVDALFDNNRCKRPVLGRGNRPLKSLTDMIKGKQGRFRENLLGKRVDYSARSVIVVGPELKLHQCGLPKKIALELFQPFIIRRLKELGHADTIKSAKKMLERKDDQVWDILEEVVGGMGLQRDPHVWGILKSMILYQLCRRGFAPTLAAARRYLGERQDLIWDILEYAARSTPHLTLIQEERSKPAPMDGPIWSGLSPWIFETFQQEPYREAFIWAARFSVPEESYQPRHGHPVLLNRAPTLHRMGIQAFEPVLIEGNAIRIHPLVCKGFNADFDGDQMAVHLPLSIEAQVEATVLMMSTNNIFSPANGQPIISPSQDIVMGCYYLTASRGEPGEAVEAGDGMIFTNPEEVFFAFAQKKIGVHARIRVRLPIKKRVIGELKVMDKVKTEDIPRTPNGLVCTTVGRVLFNDILNAKMAFYDLALSSKQLARIIADCYQQVGQRETIELLDRMKETGFREATRSGLSLSADDLRTSYDVKSIIEETEKEGEKLWKAYQGGSIADEVRHDNLVRLWGEACDRVTKGLMDDLAGDRRDGKPYLNPVYLMVASGARGDASQIRQLAGLRGLMATPSGRIIESPITGNLSKGLNVFEFFFTAHGSRKAAVDTALKTAKSGYVTRKLADVAQNVVITMHDCGSTQGVPKGVVYKGEEIERSLSESIRGRVSRDTIPTITGEEIVAENEMITWEQARKIEALGLDKILVRSLMTCQAALGVCQLCYGMDLATGNLVEEGMAVGIIAAQSVGEPGTQLTMKTHAAGGSVTRFAGGEGGAVVSDITTALPRITQLFEARRPRDAAVMAEVSGIVRLGEKKRGKRIIWVQPVDHGGKSMGEEREYQVPHGKHLRVHTGDYVKEGELLVVGPLVQHDILRISGVGELQEYLVREVQSVYRSQRVDIDDKHIEIIVSQMLRKVKVETTGDTGLLPGIVIDKFAFQAVNDRLKDCVKIKEPGASKFEAGKIVSKEAFEEERARLEAEGRKVPTFVPPTPATRSTQLLGITKAAVQSDSFISAASFQETTKVLTEAALAGKVDYLVGLKENVIMGHLIPAGTGFRTHQDAEVRLNTAPKTISASSLGAEDPEQVSRAVPPGAPDEAKCVRETSANREGARLAGDAPSAGEVEDTVAKPREAHQLHFEEIGLRARLQDVERREAAVTERERTLAGQEEALREREAAVARNEAELQHGTRETDGMARRAAELSESREEVRKREGALRYREDYAARISEHLGQRSQVLGEKEQELASRESKLLTRHQSLQRLEADLTRREQALQNQESDLGARRRAWSDSASKESGNRVEEARRLAATRQEIEAREAQLLRREAELAERLTACQREEAEAAARRSAWTEADRRDSADRVRASQEVDSRAAALQESALDGSSSAVPAQRPALPRRRPFVAVPGQWFARPANAPGEKWNLLASTPSSVPVETGRGYRLCVAPEAGDTHLVCLLDLAELPELEALSLAGCTSVTDDGLSAVAFLTHLRQLSLRACEKITDRGLTRLRSLTSLRELDLTGCMRIGLLSRWIGKRGISNAGLATLRAGLPGCKILEP